MNFVTVEKDKSYALEGMNIASQLSSFDEIRVSIARFIFILKSIPFSELLKFYFSYHTLRCFLISTVHRFRKFA